MPEIMVATDDPKTGMELELNVCENIYRVPIGAEGFDEFIEVFLECLKCDDKEGIDKVLDKWEDK